MALALAKYRLSVAFTETSGKAVNRIYEAPLASFADFGEFLAAITPAVTGFIALLNPLTDAEISSFVASSVYIENALVLPVAAENQSEAHMSAKIVGDPTDSATISIPAANIGVFVSPTGPGRDIVDTSDINLLLWLNNFDSTGAWTLSDGEQIEIPTLKGKRRSRKSNST